MLPIDGFVLFDKFYRKVLIQTGSRNLKSLNVIYFLVEIRKLPFFFPFK